MVNGFKGRSRQQLDSFCEIATHSVLNLQVEIMISKLSKICEKMSKLLFLSVREAMHKMKCTRLKAGVNWEGNKIKLLMCIINLDFFVPSFPARRRKASRKREAEEKEGSRAGLHDFVFKRVDYKML